MNASLLVILIALAGLVSQGAPPAKPLLERASLEGVVVRSGTDEPVYRARILLTNVNGRLVDSIATTADERGRFSIPNIPSGTYRLFAHHDDYVRTEYGQRAVARPGSAISLMAGQSIANIRLAMVPTGVVSGRVLNANGEPASRIRISALKRNYAEGERITTVVGDSQTNDLGEYRIYGLAPGEYLIRATPFGFRGIQGGSYVTTNPPMLDLLFSIADNRTPLATLATRGDYVDPAALEGQFYPAMDYPGTIEIRPGAIVTGVNLAIFKVPAAPMDGKGVHVRGQLINGATGEPAIRSSATLHLAERPYSLESMLQTLLELGSGSFDFPGVTPGRYLVSGDNAAGSGDLSLEVGSSDIENLRIILRPRSSLAGRLSIEGRPAGESGVPAGMTVRIKSSAISRTAAVQTDGTFTLPNVMAGEYQIGLSGGPPNYYLKAGRIGDTEILNAGLRLAGSPILPIDLLVSPNTGVLEGIVFEDDRRPAAAVTIVAIPDPSRRKQFDLYRTAVSDGSGRFRIEGLVPGEYKVFAWEDIEENSWQDPEILRPYEARGRTVRIVESARESVELQMIPR